MSFGTGPPMRTPASKRSFTISMNALFTSSSMLISGYCETMRLMAGHKIEDATYSDDEIRIVPAGFSRKCVRSEIRSSILAKAGTKVSSSRDPVSVGVTLRVVRASKRIPRRASSLRITWLKADCESPNFFAAAVKLLASATATKIVKSAKSSRSTYTPLMKLSHEFNYKNDPSLLNEDGLVY